MPALATETLRYWMPPLFFLKFATYCTTVPGGDPCARSCILRKVATSFNFATNFFAHINSRILHNCCHRRTTKKRCALLARKKMQPPHLYFSIGRPLDGIGLYGDSLLSMCHRPKARRARNRRATLCFSFQIIVFRTSDCASHSNNHLLFSPRWVLLLKVVVSQAVTMVQSFFRHRRIVWIVRTFGPLSLLLTTILVTPLRRRAVIQHHCPRWRLRAECQLHRGPRRNPFRDPAKEHFSLP